ncbi:hypothetical protein BpHYR1_018948 [Brachionus plicatilis]|uniref:Uncharacterized protein n=1 Tax=Brachionus plicatilis TaxID=10195 RepID=A0A3M7PUB8_BRAPC|nr:hypothetical protein BpHYR1_018948 [Brachionus plicatilis]
MGRTFYLKIGDNNRRILLWPAGRQSWNCRKLICCRIRGCVFPVDSVCLGSLVHLARTQLFG